MNVNPQNAGDPSDPEAPPVPAGAATPVERIPITQVRLDEGQAEQALQRYVFGGRYGGPRPPRGIDPNYVSRFLRERLKPDSPADAYARTGELLRFYERPDIVPQLLDALTAREVIDTDIYRSAYAVQAIGDLGSAEQAAAAAQYFDLVLVPHPAVDDSVFPVLIESLLPLVPAGSSEKLERRLALEVQRGSKSASVVGPAGISARRLQDLQDNRMRAALARVALKKKILALAPPLRRRELVRAYQAEIGLADPASGVWAARLLRREAREDPASANGVYAEFARAIDEAAAKPPERAGFYVRRAAQAILYLRGTLSPAHRELLEKANDRSANFLWDDLEPPSPRVAPKPSAV